ncbi:MAG: hypothetical protein U9Q00_06705 [Synergistota bacterium]|nr:hypothetical protein [Synergistota bacterium]
MKLLEAIRRHDGSKNMNIIFKDGRHLICRFETLLWEDYFSFYVQVKLGGSSEFEPGTLLEVIGEEVFEINGEKIH